MYKQVEKTKENTTEKVNNITPKYQSEDESNFQFVDNQPEIIAQRKLSRMINKSLQTQQVTPLQVMAKNSSAQQLPIQKRENRTGLPDNLKTGIENLSGYSMDDVKVHRNSNKPAQLNAHAYAQGTDIHLGSGQEKHLPHEAWHVVQQKQGRVKPTMQMKGSVNVNDDAELEKEADVMGTKAFQLKQNQDKIITQGKLKNADVNFSIQQQQSIQKNQNFKTVSEREHSIKKVFTKVTGQRQKIRKPDHVKDLKFGSDVIIKTAYTGNELKEEPIQGVFTVAVNPTKSSSGIIVESIQVGERPPTEHGSSQLNHSVPWSAIIIELNGKIAGKTPEQAYTEVVSLAIAKGLDVSSCSNPIDQTDSAMKIADVKSVIEAYLIQYNAQSGITHKDTSEFTQSSSARYAPYNARKLHEHESAPSSSTLSETELIQIVHKVIQQIVTAADPGKTQNTKTWTLEAANTFAQTSVFYLDGTHVINYIDFILNMVVRNAVEEMGISGTAADIFMNAYMKKTTKLLKAAGWKID